MWNNYVNSTAYTDLAENFAAAEPTNAALKD